MRKPEKPQLLHRRIVIAFVQLAIASSLFFGLLAAFAVEGIEEYLVDERLASVAAWASPRHAAKLHVDMPAGLVFYHGEEIPQFMRHLPEGVHEFFVDGNELHVLAGKDAAGDYVVVDHASEYDKIELVVYSVIGVGCLGFILLSMYIGGVFARRVVVPITTLSSAVRKDDNQAVLPMAARSDEIGDLARAFHARTEALQKVLDRERFFTGDVSHELRTPLTVIMGAAEIIQANAAQQPLLSEAAERILRTAKEAADSVTVLLLLAREPQRTDERETGIARVVHDEIQKYQALVAGKPVQLDYAALRDFSVQARPELLAALIGNLIRNACLYTAQGSVSVRVNAPFVMVEDTGPGLPELIRARLMKEPDLHEHRGSAGTGLGLSLVSRICEYLCISLTVSRIGTGDAVTGTMFTLDFSPVLTKT